VTSSFSILVSENLVTDDQQCLRDALGHRARHHICNRGDRNMEYESTCFKSQLGAADNDLNARVVACAISTTVSGSYIPAALLTPAFAAWSQRKRPYSIMGYAANNVSVARNWARR
jgi:hypothetical protein